MTRRQRRISTLKVTVAGAGLTICAFLVGERHAEAQVRFGDKGQLAITGENLFAFSTERVGVTEVDGEHVDTSNRFGFLYSRGTPTPHSPQLGLHFFIIPSLSLDATIRYESRGGSTEEPDPPNPRRLQYKDDESTLILVPKIDYALMLGHVVGFWFRDEVGYF